MDQMTRRKFLKSSSALAVGAASLHPLSAIAKALSIPAHNKTKSIRDVEHVVILMQENRSFDHYFGALHGVRGFNDRFPIPLPNGKPVWFQSNGEREISPFHYDSEKMNAQAILDLPHNYDDAQGAWGQGKLHRWPMFKGDTSMGYYKRSEAEFQWALADAFTLCDHYFCSITTCTDPNRVVFWSGSNIDPQRRIAGLNSDQSTAEVINQRCIVRGKFPDPQYIGSALPWKSLPEVCEDCKVSWRIYQDPNDGWNGIMNGAIAFAGIRDGEPGSNLRKNALSTWSLEDLRSDVQHNRLPSVSWILPKPDQSEHPGIPSGPARGGHFIGQLIDALTCNPESWSKTVLFITFDENDGLFDHLPPPAIPSYNRDGTLAGKSTVDLAGMYFEDDGTPKEDTTYRLYTETQLGMSEEEKRKLIYRPMIDPRDDVSGLIRPWGLGPRVPMYVISPWSKGGWVSSQVFDHTSVAQFLQKRFGIDVTTVSPWHRAICGDLSSAFDFESPNDAKPPRLPGMNEYQAIEEASKQKPQPAAPIDAEPLFFERGVRPSRALPYEMNIHAQRNGQNIALTFENTEHMGVVFHVYDKKHLDRIPRRFTVESGKQLSDHWASDEDGNYDLAVYGPNGYFRLFKGPVTVPEADVKVTYASDRGGITVTFHNTTKLRQSLTLTDNAYGYGPPVKFDLSPGSSAEHSQPLEKSGRWYDFSLSQDGAAAFERRFAGRLENGMHSHSDPAV